MSEDESLNPKPDTALCNRIRDMLDSTDYTEQNESFVAAYGKLKDDGLSDPEAISILADALKQTGEDNEAFKKLCKELVEQGENHRLVKSAGF